MICVFPDPYPDELLFSVGARYAALMDFPGKDTGSKQFFGNSVLPSVDLPTGLAALVAMLPDGHKYTINELIENNTHYRFYAPFLGEERARRLRQSMEMMSDHRETRRCAWSRRGVKRPQFLRFCPDCVTEDRKLFEETYWHRVHQLAGVEVCPQHLLFLEDSERLWMNHRNPRHVQTAEECVRPIPKRDLNPSNRPDEIRRRIAQYASQLFSFSGPPVEAATVEEHYHGLFARKGLATLSGKVRVTKLIRSLQEFYPADYLGNLGLRLDSERLDSEHRWPILATGRAHIPSHPICHILLLVFLDCELDTFLSSSSTFLPFGKSPWPCLNRASEHFGQDTITACTMRPTKGGIIGTFSCCCGFVYNRRGPDSSQDQRNHWTSIPAYGEVWDAFLTKLWTETSSSVADIAIKLGVGSETIRGQIVNLGLEYPRNSTYSAREKNKLRERYKRLRGTTDLTETVSRLRIELKSLRAQNPHANRTELSKQAKYLLTRLGWWDKNWLEEHLPPKEHRKGPGPRVNWPERDRNGALAVADTAKRIRETPGLPIRVSVHALILESQIKLGFRNVLEHLPQTAEALAKHEESHEDCFLRRIQWVEKECLESKITLSRSAFIRRAGASNRLAQENARVQSAVNSSVKKLQLSYLAHFKSSRLS